jgi:hypothetical protein
VAVVSLRERLSDPCTWAKIHGASVIIWLALIWPSITIWRESVPYLVAISVAANVVGSAAAWTAARGDRNSPTSEDLARVERKIDALRRLVK